MYCTSSRPWRHGVSLYESHARSATNCKAPRCLHIPGCLTGRITIAASELNSKLQWCRGSFCLQRNPVLFYHADPKTQSPGTPLLQDDSQEPVCCTQLSAESISTSFTLAEYEVLDVIKTVLLPTQAILTAHLREVNIYKQGQDIECSSEQDSGQADAFGSSSLPEAVTSVLSATDRVAEWVNTSLRRHLGQGRDGKRMSKKMGTANKPSGQNQPTTGASPEVPESFVQPWGSLLVCISLAHDMQLEVTGCQEWLCTNIDAKDTVQWFACSADCDGQVPPGLTGPCITFEYDLKATYAGKDQPMLPCFSAASANFTDTIVKLLSDPAFLPQGGRLGIPCQTVLPHTVKGLLDEVPSMLQSRDAVCFNVLKHLGLMVRVLAAWELYSQPLVYDNWVQRPSNERPVYKVDWNGSFGQDDKDASEFVDWSGMNQPMLCITELTRREVNRYVPWSEYNREEWSFARQIDAIRTFTRKSGAHDVHWLGFDSDSMTYAKQTVFGDDGWRSGYMRSIMSAPVIIAEVPPWSSEQRLQALKRADNCSMQAENLQPL